MERPEVAMCGIPCVARVMTAAVLLILAAPGLAQLWSPLDTNPRPARATPKLSLLCLPPGGSGGGVPCSTGTRETVLIVRTERATLDSPRLLIFKQIGENDTQRVVRVPLTPQPYISSGTHHIKVPPQLCTQKGISRWQIQIATNDFNQPETSKVQDADSVGYFQMRCN